jgi:hypothetical protein
MNISIHDPTLPLVTTNLQPTPDAIPQLVAEVYECAPDTLRAHLLEQLIKPLGLLALVAISNGIFAKIRFKSGWPDMHVRWEDAQSVQAKDVAALVERVQQVSLHSFDGLAKVLATSPVLTGSAAATILLTVLLSGAKNRRESDGRGLCR